MKIFSAGLMTLHMIVEVIKMFSCILRSWLSCINEIATLFASIILHLYLTQP